MPSAKSGWLYREGCKTCYDSAHLSLRLSPTQTDTAIPVHLLPRPVLVLCPVSCVLCLAVSGGPPDPTTFPSLPTRSLPKFFSFYGQTTRAPFPSSRPLSPSSLEPGTPPLGSCGANLRGSTPHILTCSHIPHTRLPGPGRIEQEHSRAFFSWKNIAHLCTDADAIRMVSQNSFFPRLPSSSFCLPDLLVPACSILCRVRVNVHPHLKAQVLHV
jgi:hypothetical protein